MKVNIKPLSVNECWTGRRFKTQKYKSYEHELYNKLRKLDVPKGKLIITVTFGVSSKNADWDNPIKPFQDILQFKYKFNDRQVYKGIVEKVDVKKGSEFIDFKIESYDV
jgi:Holliday junction resolvase RusA-like endonuclease